MRPKAAQGFTLIELMIVVAIIGILAAVALPAYTTYTVKAKMSEVILAASTCRVAISEVYQSGTAAPGASNWGCENVPGSTKYVASIDTDANGVITVTVRNFGDTAIDGKKVTVTPYADPAMTTALLAASVGGTTVAGWRCVAPGSGGVPARYMPSSCR